MTALAAILLNVALVTSILLLANLALFTAPFLALSVIVAACTFAFGLTMRARGNKRLASGVLVGSALALPVEVALAVVYVLIYASCVFGPSFCLGATP